MALSRDIPPSPTGEGQGERPYFRTFVVIPTPPFRISACERMLFVGSCFASSIGQRFVEDKFRAVVNPQGVMYNPASILHTVKSYDGPAPRVAVFTLGTNHVYRLKETGEIVDNCQKRPQNLFQEEELSIDQCADYLQQALRLLPAGCHLILTVSPIRYRKYGYHGSRLSKGTLLLAADRLVREQPDRVYYFPAYEILEDELRDYRFYAPDMLHPSEQAVEFIYTRFAETFFDESARDFLRRWQPIKAALAHRPFHPESEAYQKFIADTQQKLEALKAEYPEMEG